MDIKLHFFPVMEWRTDFRNSYGEFEIYMEYGYDFVSTTGRNHARVAYCLINKTFRERQHPRPTEIRQCEHWLTVAILDNNLLHGWLYHVITFQAVMWLSHISWYGSSSLGPGPSLPWKISKFRPTLKNCPSKAIFLLRSASWCCAISHQISGW